jgi:predicted ATPase
VTLTGPAGVGKTRMAIELGRGQARQRPDGVWLVDLALVGTPEDVAAVTAPVFGIRGAALDVTSDVLRRYLADWDVLLMLDNCEHVLDACAELSTTLLGACPNLRILSTSREPLGIAGEAMWRLEPLSPQHSYRLFLERARERSPELIPDEDSEAAILNICASVDHLPLGIELAAARVSIMSPAEIVVSLQGHLGELARPRRRTPAHHRSVRAAVEWSYTLLDPVEQAAFRSLAVFVGGFDADAACAVAPGMSLEVLAGWWISRWSRWFPPGIIEPDTGSWTRCARTPRSSWLRPTKWPLPRPDICGTSQRSAFRSSTGLCPYAWSRCWNSGRRTTATCAPRSSGRRPQSRV